MPSGNAEGFTVRVLKMGSDLTAGIGFLVTERHIVTCAHVVNVALGRDPREQSKPDDNVRVQIEFPKLGSADGAPSRVCEVLKWVPPPLSDASAGEDIAGLVLARGDLPEKAARLGSLMRRSPVVRPSTCSATREIRPGQRTARTVR